jgi:hypothetical protein
MISAMVIPFDDELGQRGVSQIFNYARALNTVACAMTTVASILESKRRQIAASDHVNPPIFETPVRNRHAGFATTPSPIIMRNMFT